MGQAHRISCREARDIDMVMYLSSLGFEAAKVRGNNYWYLSPLRNEHTPSFKVNRQLNRWYDFGIGKGGNLVDFGILFFHCPIADFLSSLSTGLLLPIAPKTTISRALTDSPTIGIVSVRPLQHPALVQYLSGRKIPLVISQWYCREVTYRSATKTFFAIGFSNQSGGWELRSRGFKGSSAPKDFTLICNGFDRLAVFEGFMDFLSYGVLTGAEQVQPADYLILNGLSLSDKALPIMAGYLQTFLFLDSDKAGRTRTHEILKQYRSFIDGSDLYLGFADLNDYLCNRPLLGITHDPKKSKEPP